MGERLCLVCKRNCIEDEKHFLIDCTEYESLRQQLYFHISENDATFINLTDHDRTLYLLRLDNDNTSQAIAKYAHLTLSSAEASLCCGEALCLVGRLGRKKKRASPARFLFFRLLIF